MNVLHQRPLKNTVILYNLSILSTAILKRIKTEDVQLFFVSLNRGRKPRDTTGETKQLIIALRKKYLSVPDIKSVLDVQGCKVSEKYIYNIIKEDGFDRLPRRNLTTREGAISKVRLKAPKSVMHDYTSEKFSAQSGLGLLCQIPYIQQYGIDRLIQESGYPETETISRLCSILSFAALKLSNVRRYSADDAWCMERGSGLSAGLNVLPKTAWHTSYSNNITREMNKTFLKGLHKIWFSYGLLSDTANLDFTTIPYWGDSSHLENNQSGKRNKALAGMSAVLAQDPDSGIITYADTTIRHNNKSDVAVEFLDFYQAKDSNDLKYLVFDSKFTTYKNLSKLSKDVKFLTIRRRGKSIVDKLNKKPAKAWKKIRVPMADGKGRTLKVLEEKVFLKDYGGELRQIAITGHGKVKPALIITNDFEEKSDIMIRKNSRRWLVEKSISEQIEFFHLNRVSSSMVIKVDFDLTMSVLAHNLLRLFATDLPGFSHNADMTLYNKFLSMSGEVEITPSEILVKMKKKRNLPSLLTSISQFKTTPIKFYGGRKLIFTGDTRT